jgi:glycine cleavage system H protein
MDASSPRKQELNQEYRYGRKYTWVKKSDGGEMRVGIEPGFATALPVPRAVVLPPVGDRVHRNRACAWIVLDGGTLPVQAPLDGEVKSTNGQLLNHPHIIRSAPMDQGWLFDIVTNQESLDRAGLLGIEEAAKVFAAAESRFQSLVVAELAKGGATTGVTLPDGGQMLHNTSAMLGPARYVRLLREVYG